METTTTETTGTAINTVTYDGVDYVDRDAVIVENCEGFDYSDIENAYLAYLDECNGEITIEGIGTYSYSYLLQSLDDTARRCGCSDWSSEEYEEIQGNYYSKSDIDDMEIEPIDYIARACEYFEFEGMKYGENGEELETREQVEKKAIEFLIGKKSIQCMYNGV